MCNPFEQIVNNLISLNELSNDELGEKNVFTGEELFDIFKKRLSEKSSGFKYIEKSLVTVFYENDKDVFSIQKQKNAIKIVLNIRSGSLVDAKGLFRDVSKVGHWGSGDYQIRALNPNNFDYVISTINLNR